MAVQCYSNGGFSMRIVPPGYVPISGEATFPDSPAVTADQLDVAFPGYKVALAAQNAASAALAQYSALIAAGASVESTGTPAVNGTYGIDDASRADMSDEATYIQSTGGATFSNGTGTMEYPLVNGSWAPFPSPAVFTAVAQGIARYVSAAKAAYALAAQQQPATWPTLPIVVA